MDNELPKLVDIEKNLISAQHWLNTWLGLQLNQESNYRKK
jgi:hypothetical protein